MSTIVVLNGASSSGKSSIARAFQELAPRVFLNFSIDTILYALPPSVVEGVERGECLGRARFVELARAFCGCVRELAAQGHDLVIDHAIASREDAEMVLEAISGHRALLVGLDCAVAVLSERERARGDRKVGLAASQAGRVHQWLEYDVAIDTAACSVEEAAARIVGALADDVAGAVERSRLKVGGGSVENA